MEVRASVRARKRRNGRRAKGRQEGECVSDRTNDQEPSRVRELKQGGEILARWGWVERAVWNERMLGALETGVRGGKWHSLYDKVYGLSNLKAAWKQVKANRGGGGVDRMSIADFDKDADTRLEKLSEALRTNKYKPLPVRRTYIPKVGSSEKRPLGIPTIIDRIVQTAVRNVIEPIFEKEFDPCSYGFRPNLGCQNALGEIERLLAAGSMHVVDVDLRKYFDTIPHQGLMNEVAKRIADGRVLDLIEAYLHQGVLEEMKLWMPEQGTPQGAVISPLLANVYLHPVDVAMRQAGFTLVRYADDMVVFCRTREEAEAALVKLGALLEVRGLQLHPDKTRLAHLMEKPGFQFLGYEFFDKYRNPRPSSQDKLRASIRAKTKLTTGHSFKDIISMLNASLRGWHNYFKFCSATNRAWAKIDAWVRFRLRAILDKRRKGGRSHRRGRGHAHYRWPNAYFTEHGLFSLVSAVKLVRQS
jgi:RNA-directed DNA polymerase